jgi:hypothetical protein
MLPAGSILGENILKAIDGFYFHSDFLGLKVLVPDEKSRSG